jgi:hypothetical protein
VPLAPLVHMSCSTYSSSQYAPLAARPLAPLVPTHLTCRDCLTAALPAPMAILLGWLPRCPACPLVAPSNPLQPTGYTNNTSLYSLLLPAPNLRPLPEQTPTGRRGGYRVTSTGRHLFGRRRGFWQRKQSARRIHCTSDSVVVMRGSRGGLK